MLFVGRVTKPTNTLRAATVNSAIFFSIPIRFKMRLI
jgi:hypothetical protein